MPTAPAVQSTAPPPAVSYAPGWAPVALTPRGTAACRLAEFRNVWAELSPADRAWFAEDLRDLLVDAVLPETA